MSIGSAIEDKVKQFVVGIALKKGVVSLAKLIVSWCAARGISIVSAIGGIQIDTSNEMAMTAAINALLSVVKNWLKTKWPDKFGWL